LNIRKNEILITGGGSGLGFALSKVLVELGNKVFICDVSADKVHNAVKSIPGLQGVACDLSKTENYLVLFEAALKALPEINIIINNAAVCQDLDFTQAIPEGCIKWEVMVNLMAPLELTCLFLPELFTREAAAIVNISSRSGVRPDYPIPIYSATKAGLSYFTEALRNRLRHILDKKNTVRIIEVYPPIIDTPMNAQWTNVKKKSPDIVALAIVEGIKMNREVIWGDWTHVRLYWFLTRWLIRIVRFPGKAIRVIALRFYGQKEHHDSAKTSG